MQIKQSTADLALVFFMVDSTDHVTGKTGLTPTVTLSKNGGSFASPAGAVLEIGNGFYKVAANSTDSNTLGVLALTATGTGADRCAMAFEVVANIESDSVSAIASVAAAIDSMGLVIDALNNVSVAQIRTELATELARIDVAVSSRNATAPDNAGIAAIKAKTDNLPAAPAAVSNIPTAAAIADAVWDEAMSGHSTAGTAGSQLTAAGASGDPWATVIPGSYADGTAGAAIGRLNNTPADAPIVVIPDPSDDANDCVVYLDTQSIENVKQSGVEIEIKLSGPATTSTGVAVDWKTRAKILTDAEGRAEAPIERTDTLVPSTRTYSFKCEKYGIDVKGVTLTTSTFNIATLIPSS